MPEKSLAVFEGKQIRRHYDEASETWYFSVVDIMQVLIPTARLSSREKLLEGLEEPLKQRRKRVGYKM